VSSRTTTRTRIGARQLPSPDSNALLLLAASAAQAAVSYVLLGLPSIGPQLRNHFGLSLPELGTLLATMQLGSGLALIPAGRAADRWGSRAVTRVGTLITVAGMLVGAASTSAGVLFIGLLIAGVGSAIVPVSGAGAIFRVYPPQRRAWALGIRQMAVPVGGLLASLTVPPLDRLGGTRVVLIVGAVGVALTGVAFSAVSDSVRIRHDRSVRIVRGIWHGPGIGRLLVVTVAYLFVLQSVLVCTVPAMHAAGFPAFQASLAYFLVNLAAIASRVVWGRVADLDSGTRRKRSLVETGVLSSVGALLFGVALHLPLVFVLTSAAFFAFASLGWNAVVYAMAGEWAGPQLGGRAFSVAATVVFIGAAVVNPVIGGLAQWAGWNALWVITALVGIVGALAAASLPDRGAVRTQGAVEG
jgi:MFS family permease